MLDLLPLLLARAHAAPDVVVTLDNGEFNLPFYTPRWNGKWERPSAAQELVAAVARVAGANPRTYTYLPPDQGRAGPGGAFEVLPRRPNCTGPAASAADPCFCGPGDNCWSGVRPNWYAGASTSLWLTASSTRRAGDPARPRLEVHVTDLFEEDPAAAADPKDSDRCVTADGVRRAVAALLAEGDGLPLDHVSFGVLRATVDPPPPGGSWGERYVLGPTSPGDEATCHGGTSAGDWSSTSGVWRGNMLVIVLGYGTAGDSESVSSFLDGIVGQLDTDGFEIELARLREPVAQLGSERSISARELAQAPLRLQGSGRRADLPCTSVEAVATLMDVDGHEVPAAASAGCDAVASVSVEERALTRAFLREAGLNPATVDLTLHGTVTMTGTVEALRERWTAVTALNEGDRPLPLIGALDQALFTDGAARPWRTELTLTSLGVSDADRRPWGLSMAVGGVLGAVAGMVTAGTVRRLHADRALRRHWTRSLGSGQDPRLQLPLASVLGAAQEEVARNWPGRVVAGAAVGIALTGLVSLAILLAYLVLLG